MGAEGGFYSDKIVHEESRCHVNQVLTSVLSLRLVDLRQVIELR